MMLEKFCYLYLEKHRKWIYVYSTQCNINDLVPYSTTKDYFDYLLDVHKRLIIHSADINRSWFNNCTVTKIKPALYAIEQPFENRESSS
jgi:predicted restriction endonuclease